MLAGEGRKRKGGNKKEIVLLIPRDAVSPPIQVISWEDEDQLDLTGTEHGDSEQHEPTSPTLPHHFGGLSTFGCRYAYSVQCTV